MSAPRSFTPSECERLANMPSPQFATVWTRQDVARVYKVSLRTVGQWIAERRIPCMKLGRTVRFRPAAVTKALEKFEIKAVGGF